VKLVDQSGSLGVRRFFARSVAYAAWGFSRRRRQSRERNLAQTLNLSVAEIGAVAKNCFYEFWQGVFSLSCSGSRRPIHAEVELRGFEHLQKAVEKGKGVILWESSFFGKRILAKRILHENGVSVCQVHGQDHLEGFHSSKSWIGTNIIRPFFASCESPFVKEILHLPPSDLAFSRTLWARLKRNDIICIAADGNHGHKFMPAQFLGSTEFFSTGMVSLAKLSGATILPLFCFRESGRRASVVIEGPIQIETNEDRDYCSEKSVRQYAGLLESYIRRYPEQYLHWEAYLRTPPVTRHPPLTVKKNIEKEEEKLPGQKRRIEV